MLSPFHRCLISYSSTMLADFDIVPSQYVYVVFFFLYSAPLLLLSVSCSHSYSHHTLSGHFPTGTSDRMKYSNVYTLSSKMPIAHFSHATYPVHKIQLMAHPEEFIPPHIRESHKSLSQMNCAGSSQRQTRHASITSTTFRANHFLHTPPPIRKRSTGVEQKQIEGLSNGERQCS